MLKMKITRDKAREIQQHFFPYLLLVCENKMAEAEEVKDAEAKMISRMLLCLVTDLKLKFDKRLLTEYNTFTIKITDAEAICFYQLLMNFPIDTAWVFMIVLRQEVTDFLYGQLGL